VEKEHVRSIIKREHAHGGDINAFSALTALTAFSDVSAFSAVSAFVVLLPSLPSLPSLICDSYGYHPGL
jgi:hypothetical protein